MSGFLVRTDIYIYSRLRNDVDGCYDGITLDIHPFLLVYVYVVQNDGLEREILSINRIIE